ncbi:hypothetical protein Bhyg_09191 [Pseudolycoriella hygida]|uniref:C3H1-type domain-containing protein n=1 Tax=Pseudolycoriella hygida TaxID=35572 RepID=A0A9Q0N673_9DIPT|nr:hypothetical protein Bhyg_09191 [Pseudolycoriella hygida]
MSLVPAYASSSDDDDSTHSSENEASTVNETSQRKTESISLPSASSLLSGISKGAIAGHVFNNPYKDAENAKIASLEKHVKMVATEEHIQVKNGKKICWNYRKGRCRFGSNCTFAHDEIEVPRIPETTQDATEENQTKYSQPPNVKKKKRPGLGDSVTPSKRTMKHYHRTQSSK